MAAADTVSLNEPHHPKPLAIEAFGHVVQKIKQEIITSRHRWNKHEPRMWSRASNISDTQLVDFTIEEDLVEVRAGQTSYGTIIFGKIRIPALTTDNEGEGFVHVRIHDPPDRGTEDVMFHSIFTDEGKRSEDGHAERYQAIQSKDTPLDFFNE